MKGCPKTDALRQDKRPVEYGSHQQIDAGESEAILVKNCVTAYHCCDKFAANDKKLRK
ncbi:MAG: hypothetical protein LBC74_08065 [Planctomycetaceae bacterium]|nr:hypothetical protein [Planctomycetaceae bacterium]